MYFNKWLTEQLEQLPITRKELSRSSGVSYSSMNGSKRFNPRISNLVIICEVLTESTMIKQYLEYRNYQLLPEWRRESLRQKRRDVLDTMIISAIASCGVEYTFAANRLEEPKQ